MEDNNVVDPIEIYDRIEKYLAEIRDIPPLPELSPIDKLMRSPADLREELHTYGDILIKLQNMFSECRVNSYRCKELIVSPPEMTGVAVSSFRHRIDQYLSLFISIEDTYKLQIKVVNDVIEVLRSINSSTRMG